MEQKSLNAPWDQRFTWDELMTLAVCLSLDLLEYLLPILMAPIFGDMVDLIGIVFTIIYFRFYGILPMIELIPGFDILPLYTITWITWYIQSSRVRKKQIREQLDAWR